MYKRILNSVYLHDGSTDITEFGLFFYDERGFVDSTEYVVYRKLNAADDDELTKYCGRVLSIDYDIEYIPISDCWLYDIFGCFQTKKLKYIIKKIVDPITGEVIY